MVGKLNPEGIEFRFRQLFLSTGTLEDVSFYLHAAREDGQLENRTERRATV